MKTCTKCKTHVAYDMFHKDRSRTDGYRNICKKCVSLYMHENYNKNRERIIEKVYAWIDSNRARHNEKCRRWVKNNTASVNARTAKRYAAKTQATPKWLTDTDHWAIQEAYALAKLRAEMLGGNWEVDHIVPLRGKTVMGLHVPWNLQVILRNENRRKANRVLVT